MPVDDKKLFTSESKLVSEVLSMNATISSKADTSSVRYEGRAKISYLEDIWPMETQDWRDRLRGEIKRKGRSMRSISMAIKKGDGYVHSILEDEKDPTISNLLEVCREVGVSLSWVLYGFEISAETEEILSLLEGHPDSRAAVLQILRDKRVA